MTKEQRFKTMVWAGAFCLILASFYIGIKLGIVYLAIFLVCILCAEFFVLLQFYLRIQHNIDNSIAAVDEVSRISELNIINIVNEVRTLKSDVANLYNEIIALKNDLNSKLSSEKELFEQIVDFFEDLLNYLEDNKKEIAEIGINSAKKIEELKDFYGKVVILLQQIAEYQEDQTDFLKKEMDKSHAEP